MAQIARAPLIHPTMGTDPANTKPGLNLGFRSRVSKVFMRVSLARWVRHSNNCSGLPNHLVLFLALSTSRMHQWEVPMLLRVLGSGHPLLCPCNTEQYHQPQGAQHQPNPMVDRGGH